MLLCKCRTCYNIVITRLESLFHYCRDKPNLDNACAIFDVTINNTTDSFTF